MEMTFNGFVQFITSERFVEFAKLVALIGGGFFALFPWWYNYLEQRAKARQAAEYPWESECSLLLQKVKDFGDGTFLYDVAMNVRVKNISGSKFDLSYSIEAVYIGCVDVSDISAIGNALFVNPPPSPWLAHEGAIRWERKGLVIGVSREGEGNGEVMALLEKEYPNEKVVQWAALTGPASSGTSKEDTPAFILKARPDDYVAIVMSFGINGTIDPNSPLTGSVRQWQRFSESTEKLPAASSCQTFAQSAGG